MAVSCILIIEDEPIILTSIEAALVAGIWLIALAYSFRRSLWSISAVTAEQIGALRAFLTGIFIQKSFADGQLLTAISTLLNAMRGGITSASVEQEPVAGIANEQGGVRHSNGIK